MVDVRASSLTKGGTTRRAVGVCRAQTDRVVARIHRPDRTGHGDDALVSDPEAPAG